MKRFIGSLQADLSASLVVFLVALPLCMGIAIGSGADPMAGLVAGIVGGIVVGLISGSSLSVSGPAAGLTVVVAAAIADLPSYGAFLLSVVIAGFFQIILGKIRAGSMSEFVPSSVIKGMLAAIGLILIMKQLPHFLGCDTNFEGDETFSQNDGQNTFTEVAGAFLHPSARAILIGLFSIGSLLLWQTNGMKQLKLTRIVPGSLVVVFAGIFINEMFLRYAPGYALGPNHTVNIPVSGNFNEFLGFFRLPDFQYLLHPKVWFTAITIAAIASIETLLGIEAVDKLDPKKRVSPPNRELIAQGAGNIFSGLLGGLPVTSVIVRSSANVGAGAQSKWSAVFHGALLLVCVYFIPSLLNKIPLTSLAAVLIFVGYKLTSPALYFSMYKKGLSQFLPFVITIVAIMLSDLLVGVAIGILSGIYFIIQSNFRTTIQLVEHGN
ncbi:MAG: SulP family inorganic anion transporter, partial [Crocinitomicaceae bacterium]|nr:SulP family inorganic anion transporter [Crocinitomicaceae bacterium]